MDYNKIVHIYILKSIKVLIDGKEICQLELLVFNQ